MHGLRCQLRRQKNRITVERFLLAIFAAQERLAEVEEEDDFVDDSRAITGSVTVPISPVQILQPPLDLPLRPLHSVPSQSAIPETHSEPVMQQFN